MFRKIVNDSYLMLSAIADYTVPFVNCTPLKRIESDSYVYEYNVRILDENTVGDVVDDRYPLIAHQYDADRSPGFTDGGVIGYNYAKMDVPQHSVEDTIALITIHELTHWACMGQGPEFAEAEPTEEHSMKWNPVLIEEIEYVADADSDVATE